MVIAVEFDGGADDGGGKVTVGRGLIAICLGTSLHADADHPSIHGRASSAPFLVT